MDIKHWLKLHGQRMGMICYLAIHLPTPPGKTSIQKFTYMLQEIYGVPLEYDFEFYNHGPYASELMSDLDSAETIGGISIESVNQGSFLAYKISSLENAEEITGNNQEFLNKYKKEIDDIIAKFGDHTARSLELRATIVFVVKYRKRDSFSEDEIVTKVSELKPKYDIEEIENAYKELDELGLIEKVKRR